jgi:hypothetical protein
VRRASCLRPGRRASCLGRSRWRSGRGRGRRLAFPGRASGRAALARPGPAASCPRAARGTLPGLGGRPARSRSAAGCPLRPRAGRSSGFGRPRARLRPSRVFAAARIRGRCRILRRCGVSCRCRVLRLPRIRVGPGRVGRSGGSGGRPDLICSGRTGLSSGGFCRGGLGGLGGLGQDEVSLGQVVGHLGQSLICRGPGVRVGNAGHCDYPRCLERPIRIRCGILTNAARRLAVPRHWSSGPVTGGGWGWHPIKNTGPARQTAQTPALCANDLASG